MGVRVSFESKRGCGFRKVGGLYLVSGEPSAPCGRLPFRLECCAACGSGIKFARGFTWIRPKALFQFDTPECTSGNPLCRSCPVGFAMPEKAGLLWVGEKFYPTPADFMNEARRMGISKRIATLPRDLEIGKTWVYLAHPKAIQAPCGCVESVYATACERELEIRAGECEHKAKHTNFLGMREYPGVITAFVPSAVEKVVDETITPEEVEALEKRGISPVIVKPVQGNLFDKQQEVA